MLSMTASELVKKLDNLIVERLVLEKVEAIQIIRHMVQKMSKQMKVNFYTGLCIEIYVTDVKKAEIELFPHMIKNVSNFWVAYFFYEIVRDDINLFANKMIQVRLIEYTKNIYEAKEFINALLNSVVHLGKGISLDLNSIESILSEDDLKVYAKGAKESVINTLTKKSVSNTFRIHPDYKERIVGIQELGRYLDLGGRHRSLDCPVCGEKYMIDKQNINNVIHFQDNKFIFNCLHTKTEIVKDIDKKRFVCDLSEYLNNTINKYHKQMFVLNNFTMIVKTYET